MTDQNQNLNPNSNDGGGDAGAAAAAAAAAAAGGGGGGADGGATSWLESLPEALRGDRNLAKYESLEAFANGHINTIKRLGKDPERLIEMPAKPDDTAGWDEFFGKLGRPAKAADYAITLGEGADDRDKAFLEGFRETAHKAGLSQTQMAAAVGYVNQVTVQAAEAATAEADKRAAETQTALKAEWGDKFDLYQKGIGKLIEDLGGAEAFGALEADGFGDSLPLMRILAKMTDKLAEGGLPGGGDKGVTGAKTPYQAQAEISALHADPVKRKALEDKNDPLHKVVLAERDGLLKLAYPSQT